MGLIHLYYKDTDTINSLYAQIYSGLLKEVSSSESSQRESTISGESKGSAEASAVILKGNFELDAEASKTNQISQSRSEILIPHDAAILDVLEKLTPFMKKDLNTATRGDIVNLKGTIHFIPKEMEASSFEAFDPIIETMVKTQFSATNPKEKKLIEKLIKNALKTSSNNCRFIFKDEQGNTCSGMLKTQSFCEDGLSLFLKYNANPIPCQLIGLLERYEKTSQDYNFNPSNVFEALQTLSGATANAWSMGTKDSIPLTPIVFFMPLNT